MSLFSALAVFLTVSGIFASPAAAFSLNPDAGSPGVADVNTFHWIIFLVILAAIVVVNLAILRATRPRHRHVTESGTRSPSQVKVASVLGVIALAVFTIATVYSDKSREVPSGPSDAVGLNADQQLEIRATGQQWLWRYDYPNGAFSYHRLVVPSDTTVALNLVSSDVVHGWNVPSLTPKAQAVPGKTNRVYFRADEEGIHAGRASVLSGQGYDTMEAQVEVVSPADYEAFITRQKSEIQEAQDAVAKQIEGAS